MVEDVIDSGDEELPGLRASNWRWRAGVGLGAALLIAAVVVGLVRHSATTPTSTRRSASVAVSSVPTLGTAHAPVADAVGHTFNVGQHGRTVTLYGPAVLLVSPCEVACSASFAVPAGVADAIRRAIPDCHPVLNETVSHHAGRSHVQQREVACLNPPTTLVVNIARVHSTLPDQSRLDGGALVGASRVRGPFTVQVFLQNRRGPHPSVAVARALVSDPRLLTATDTAARP